MTNVVDFPKRNHIYVMEFEASPEFLGLVDEVRGGMGPDEFLFDCMRVGLTAALLEWRPEFNPGEERPEFNPGGYGRRR